MTARRCLTLLLSALLLAPASAQADFSETPIYDFKGEPSCLAPTGAPGEVAIGNSHGARLLQATRAGFVPAGDVKAGEGFTCGSIVARPSGAGVIAGTQYYGDSVVAVVRDPGGAWSEPLSIAAREGWTPQTVVGAVSDRGDVVVAWLEERNRPESQIRVRLATRAPGQPFGPAKVVHTSTGMGYAQGIDAEVAATGEAVVSWTALDASAKGAPRVATNVAIVAPDGTPAWSSRSSSTRSAAPSLSVASDGRALFAYTHDGYVTFIERPPGGAFGAPVKLARVTDPAGWGRDRAPARQRRGGDRVERQLPRGRCGWQRAGPRRVPASWSRWRGQTRCPRIFHRSGSHRVSPRRPAGSCSTTRCSSARPSR